MTELLHSMILHHSQEYTSSHAYRKILALSKETSIVETTDFSRIFFQFNKIRYVDSTYFLGDYTSTHRQGRKQGFLKWIRHRLLNQLE